MRLTRRERIRLLLESYIDAASPGRGDSDVRSAPGSRQPARSYLWAQGSYSDLARELNGLYADGYTKIHRHLCAFYFGGPRFVFIDQKTGRISDCGDGGPQKRYVERGVDLLMKRMPANVYVPSEIVENGGFTPGEAKIAAKRKVAA